jgi:hypothetical protein
MAVAFDSHVTGIVRSVNEKGLKLDGYDSWHNYSKWADGVVAPERGQYVTLTLDKAGFIRAVAPADGASPLPVRGASDVPAAPSVKDRTITRLAVLKAAAEFASFRGDLKSGDVLAIALRWEKWVTREDPLSDDLLEDAF